MKQMTRLVCLLLVCVLLFGCAPQGENTETTAPVSTGAALGHQGSDNAAKTEQTLEQIALLGTSPDDNYRTWYEIFVYSFCDSNGDGIGDLQGVISKLDYLQELGINGIWLMPIHPSSSYHKYNVSDYFEIDPAYGTLEDFRQLLDACEKRDIHLIMDLVVNHTSSTHEWFTAACEYLRSLEPGQEPNSDDCEYLDYYFFSKEMKSGHHSVTGTQWYYEGMFDSSMPDLNLDNPRVREQIAGIMKYWIDLGVSGFRLDAAKEFFSGNVQKNVEVLNWIQQTATALKPDCYLVAEVWEGFQQIARYYESDITSIFNFAFGNADGKIVSVLRGAGNASTVASYATALEKADTAYAASNGDYIDAPFLSNHDVGRIAGFVNRDESKIKMAGAMNIFMSGSVFIYYGEEIGMTGSGNDPSKRAPMYWNSARDNGTTNPPPECELPSEYPFASLEEQVKDDYSIYNYYRQLIAIRQALPVISHGKTTAESSLNVGCVSAQKKTWNDQACIILMNISGDAADVDLSFHTDWTTAATLSVDETPVTQEGTTLHLPPYGIAVLIPAK